MNLKNEPQPPSLGLKRSKAMTREEAKRIYLKNGCSAFFLARGGDRYEEFREMHIPKEKLEEWAAEYLKDCIDKISIKETRDNFSYANLVIAEHHSRGNLKAFIDMLQKLKFGDEITPYAACYSILGMRNLKVNCGILDYAKESNDEELYRSLLEFTRVLIEKIQVEDDKKQAVDEMKELLSYYK